MIPRQIYKRSRKNYRGSFVECNLQNHRMYITYIFDDIAQLPSNILKMWTEPKLILKFSIRQFTFTVQKATKKIKIINEGHKSNSIQVDPEKVSLWEIWFYVSLIYNLKNTRKSRPPPLQVKHTKYWFYSIARISNNYMGAIAVLYWKPKEYG